MNRMTGQDALIAALRAQAREAPDSGIVEIMKYGRARGGVTGLWAGEGDTPTPPFIVETATRALAAGVRLPGTRVRPVTGEEGRRVVLRVDDSFRTGQHTLRIGDLYTPQHRRIEADAMRISGTLVTTNGVVREVQEFRLQGALIFTLASGQSKRTDIDVVLSYTAFEAGQLTASGQMGPVQMPAGPMQSFVPPSRCSRPREGCGPLAVGDAPCTFFPRCPG